VRLQVRGEKSEKTQYMEKKHTRGSRPERSIKNWFETGKTQWIFARKDKAVQLSHGRVKKTLRERGSPPEPLHKNAGPRGITTKWPHQLKR